MSRKPSASGRVKGIKLPASEQVELVRVSLDEINLATFPVSVLDKKAQRSHEPLQFRDIITVAGRQVERHWKVFPHQEEGFPGPADDDVLMALFELTREQGGTKKIFFTRYQLCKKLGWPLNTFYYKRIESSFRKLAAVHIEATNAFGDQERKKFINMGFTIIQEYKLFDEAAGREKLSYVLWSDRIAASISQKLTKNLDASFYFEELETPLEKRLFRYLDNHFDQGMRQLTLKLQDLCYEHLGIGRRYRYTSQLMQKLEGPLEKLVTKGFLSYWRLEGELLLVVRAEEFAVRVKLSLPMTEMIEDISAIERADSRHSNGKKSGSRSGGSKPSSQDAETLNQSATDAARESMSAGTAADAAAVAETPDEAPDETMIAEALTARGIGPAVARDIAKRAHGNEPEVIAAIHYFDAECARGKRFDNPAGLLVSLIRRSLPAEQMPPPRARKLDNRKLDNPNLAERPRARAAAKPLPVAARLPVIDGGASPVMTDESMESVDSIAGDLMMDGAMMARRAELEYQQYLIEFGRSCFAKLSSMEQKRLLAMAQTELQSGVHASKYRRMPAEKFAEHLQALVETELSRAKALPFDRWYQQWRQERLDEATRSSKGAYRTRLK